MAHSLGRPAVASCAAAGGHRCRHAAAVKPLNAAGACRPLQLRPLLVVGAGVTTTSPWAVQRSWVAAADTASSGSSGAPEGQVSAAIMESMQAKIKDELQADTVLVSDVYGDGRHVSIDVVSTAFEGKTSVQRQRMVYKAIWMELQETVHAVDAMTTKTPQEASA